MNALIVTNLEKNRIYNNIKIKIMKTFILSITFIIWMIMTFILAISIVGLVVLMREDIQMQSWEGEEGETVWFKIGKKITNKLIESV